VDLIGSIAMTQHQAELQVRRALEMSEALIEKAVLRIPLAVSEIIALGGKLESDNASIRDITACISEEDGDEASDFQRNRVITLIRQIKHTEQKSGCPENELIVVSSTNSRKPKCKGRLIALSRSKLPCSSKSI